MVFVMMLQAQTILFMLHNNYTQQEYKSYHVILPADSQNSTGELILGDLNAATDVALMQEHNVKTIITAAAGLEHLQIPAEQTHVVFPLMDLKNENIDTYFELSYQTIELNLKRGSVLVHCGAGISRSATLIIAYYMKKYQSQFSNALKFIKNIRPNVCPNLGFELQLKKYQQKLTHDSTHAHKASNTHKQIQQQKQGGSKSNRDHVLEAKPMTLTFNLPPKQHKTARMTVTNTKNFSAHTPLIGRKTPHLSTQKRSKIEQGGLFIEGRTAVGELKSESMYDPEKYWYKGSVVERKKEINSFKI